VNPGGAYDGIVLQAYDFGTGDSTIIQPDGQPLAACQLDSTRRLICNDRITIVTDFTGLYSVYTATQRYFNSQAGLISALKCSISAPPANIITCDAVYGRSAFYLLDPGHEIGLHWDSATSPQPNSVKINLKAVFF
jgi:hypothetical protein